MVKIFIDNQPFEANGHVNLLQACLSLGFNIPYFCWHPVLGSVGACRQCAVKQFRDADDRRGRIVMSCMTPVTEGLRISIDDPEVIEFRRSVIEWLMTNHPHDCPVCDEGGHCHLQDMTVMTGHNYRRYRFLKRTYRNQDLGPFVNHEMNRCIQCYRCVRFYRDTAGGRDFNVFASRNNVYFGRAQDGTLESPFSGNLVEICPTGVFTDKTLGRHYTRKWDLQMAPSVCVHCAVGCNTTPGERYGELRRLEARYNSAVNGYFLCDRGRYGYEFVNHPRRLRHPKVRVENSLGVPPSGGIPAKAGTPEQETTNHAGALARGAALLSEARGVIGIGSPRASLESNYALRALVGPERFYAGVAARAHRLIELALELMRGPARSPSRGEIERCDAVLILGEDLTNTAPMLDLAVRQAARQKPLEAARAAKIPEWLDGAVRNHLQNATGPVFAVTPAATALDGLAQKTIRGGPEIIARMGFAMAHALDPKAPGVNGIGEALAETVEEIARALREARQPLVIAGTSLESEAVMRAAAAVAWALAAAGRPARLALTVPECNSLGLGLMGARPLEEALEALRSGAADTAIVLENDLYRRADAAALDEAFARARLIALDHLENATTARANLALPAGTFAEADGTLVNNEGRAQRFYQVFVPDNETRESWRWISELMAAAGHAEGARWHNLDDVAAALARELPAFAPLSGIAPPAAWREHGLRLNRMPHRASGRTAVLANVTVHEPRPPDDPDSPLAFSMEGWQGQAPSPLIPFFWAPGWNSTVQAFNKFQQEVGGPLRGGDPGVRLVEPSGVPAPYPAPRLEPAPAAGEWQIVPMYHVFGSDELSMLSPGVAQRAPAPCVALGPEDFSALGLEEGEVVGLVCSGVPARFELPARLEPTLAPGLAGVARGLPGAPAPGPSGRCRIERKARR